MSAFYRPRFSPFSTTLGLHRFVQQALLIYIFTDEASSPSRLLMRSILCLSQHPCVCCFVPGMFCRAARLEDAQQVRSENGCAVDVVTVAMLLLQNEITFVASFGHYRG